MAPVSPATDTGMGTPVYSVILYHSLLLEFRFGLVRRDLCIGNGFMDTDLYFIGHFLHISLCTYNRIVGGDRYIIQYSMCSNAGIIESFAGLDFEIVCHFRFNSFSLTGFTDIILVYDEFLYEGRSTTADIGQVNRHHSFLNNSGIPGSAFGDPMPVCIGGG
jgi:hypothetical protein